MPPSDPAEPHQLMQRRCCQDAEKGIGGAVSAFADDKFSKRQPEGNRRSKTKHILLLLGAPLLVMYALLPSDNTGAWFLQGAMATKTGEGSLDFDCPASAEKASSSFNAEYYQEYLDNSKNLMFNMTEFKNTFRESDFDTWGHTYDVVKQKSYDWKSKHFPAHLKSGDRIYESAVGIGLNLMMTLEILEEHGVRDLQLYGNEYVQASTDKANLVLEKIPPGGAQKKKICTGDSSDLYFVPSDSFDLVYTGYLSPRLDPLDFNLGSNDANFQRYRTLCEADPNDTAKKDLLAKGQQIQNDWYGKWVGEMARIAKPGAPVIVEQVSVPYCDLYIDWGGVKVEFWKEAAENDTYGWDVDPDSIVIEADTIFQKRYHVKMIRKTKD